MIQDIIDELVIVQKAIVPPAGEKALTEAYDEPPGAVNTFPCFVNEERAIPEINRGANLRRTQWLINMHLLFARSDQKYSARTRRKWIPVVLDAFDRAIMLNLARLPVQYAPVEGVSFEPVQWGETEYIAATFVLRAELSEAFTFET